MLCGGRSQRMGRPKALLPWFGHSLIEHVVERLAPCVDEVLVVRSSGLGLPASLDARVVVDREPERGPLAALRDGLAAARAELAFVTSVDAPFLSPGHIAALFAEAEGHGRATAARADGFLQVLSAVYPCLAWREADTLLIAGIASPTAFLERLGFVALATEPADGIAPWTGFNTPAEYLELARRQDPRATAVVEWRSGASQGSGARSGEPIRRTVAIGLLGDVLRAAAPVGTSLDGARAAGRLSVSLGEGELPQDFDLGLPVGPGELVVVQEGAHASSALCGGAR